jgi:hypothetical protein
MSQKIIMHDQVFNKVEDIMNHYKKKAYGGLNAVIEAIYETVIGDLRLPVLGTTPFKMAHYVQVEVR